MLSYQSSCRLVPAHEGMRIGGAGWWKCLGCHWCHPWIPAPYRGTGHACDRRNDDWGAGMTMRGRGYGALSGGNRPSRNVVWDALSYEPLVPAHQGMKSRSCGLVQRICTADSATPHPDPSGGQAPALHFLIPPSTIGLQFGTFRRWRAGIEVDWRAHFRSNDARKTGPRESE